MSTDGRFPSSARWFELFVGLRYIRAAGGNRFVSFISLISVLGITIGVAVLLVVLSVVNGFETELRSRILAMTSHGAVIGFDGGIPDWQRARTATAAHPGVVDTAPFVEGEGMLLAEDRVSAVSVRGVLPAEESRISGIDRVMTHGSLAGLEAGAYRIVLGAALARELEVAPGDSVVLAINQGVVTPAGLVPRLRRFTVSGLFEAGMYEYDRSLALVHMADARKLYRMGDTVSGIRLAVADLFAAPSIVREVAMELGGRYYVTDWTRQHQNFFRSIAISKRMLFTVLLLVVGVAAFNIVSTLVMVVKDKQGDIAILRSMGAGPGSIMALFSIQGTVIGVLGVLAGLALGILVAANTEALVHGLEAVLNTRFLAPDVYLISDLPAEVRVGDVATVCGIALVLAVLSTVYPALRGARTQPAEALRDE